MRMAPTRVLLLVASELASGACGNVSGRNAPPPPASSFSGLPAAAPTADPSQGGSDQSPSSPIAAPEEEIDDRSASAQGTDVAAGDDLAAVPLPAPAAWSVTDTSRYGMQMQRMVHRWDHSELELARLREPISLAQFEARTSMGRGYLARVRGEESAAGFVFVNTRDFGRSYQYREVAIYQASSRVLCMATDLRTDREVEGHIRHCHDVLATPVD